MNSILEILIRLRDEPSYIKEYHGITVNLYHYYGNKDVVNSFMVAAHKEIYGSYQAFPIEGDHKTYIKVLNEKWNPKNKYGKARLELLDKLIDFAQRTKIYKDWKSK